MPYGLVLDDDKRVAAWVFSNYKIFPMHTDRAIGIVKEGSLVGGILLQNYNGLNIELSYYGPWTLSAGIVKVLARIGINEFNVSRATIITSKKNKRLMRSLQRFGWRLEGTQRCFYGRNDCSRNTGIRFVMFREYLNKIARLSDTKKDQKQG